MSSWKDDVRIATTQNLSPFPPISLIAIDDVASLASDRVHVKDQTDGSQNGIWVAQAVGGWSRASDANTVALLTPEMTVRVSEGAQNAHTEWILATQGSITPDTTPLQFWKTTNTILENGNFSFSGSARAAGDIFSISNFLGDGQSDDPNAYLAASLAGYGGICTGIHGRHGNGSSTPPDVGAGVYGDSDNGFGVYGSSLNEDGIFGQGAKNGVHGQTDSPNDSGIWGENTGPPPSGTNQSYGVTGTSVNGDGIFGRGARNGVHGQSTRANDSGVWGQNTGPPPSGTNQSYGVTGTSVNGDGIFGRGAKNGIHGQTASSSDSGVWGENTGSGFGVAGKSDSGPGIRGDSNSGNAGEFYDNVYVNGTLTVNVDVQLQGQDCAEDFDIEASTDAEPGTVMVLDECGLLQESRQAYDKKVAGVVSGAGKFRPGLILGRGKANGGSHSVPLALIGRVYCKVDAQHAPIGIGDLLTTSTTAGHAMTADDPAKAFGCIIGKALKPLKRGRGLIPILVALQ